MDSTKYVRCTRELRRGIYVIECDYGEKIGIGEVAIMLTPDGYYEAVNCSTDDDERIIDAWSWEPAYLSSNEESELGRLIEEYEKAKPSDSK